MKTISTTLACILVLALSAGATDYTVKAAGGGNFSTISACAAVAVAGDTCTVYAGSYSGWTQTTSGTAGNPITFTVNPGDTVDITSEVTVTNTNYITIGAPDAGGGCANSGRTTGAGGANPTFVVGGCFVFVSAGIQGPTTCSGHHTNYLHVTYNTSRGWPPHEFLTFQQSWVTGDTSQCGSSDSYIDSTSNNNLIAHNDVNWYEDWRSGDTFCTNQVTFYGNNNRWEYNDMQNTGAQHWLIGGSYNVLRFNWAHNDDGSRTPLCQNPDPAHIDFFISEGGAAPSLAYSLVEKNVWTGCVNDSENCKFYYSRANNAVANNTSANVIVRYGYAYNIDGGFGGAGFHTDGTNTTPNWHAYNNSISSLVVLEQGAACGNWDSGIATERNSICYNTNQNTWSPTYFGQGGGGNGDLAYNTTCTTNCTWNGNGTWYSSEPMYSKLANQNPLFANYPTDGTLQTTSPARNAAAPLTTVSSGCGTNSLTVGDAGFFQPGWGPSNMPVAGDQIIVGASSTAQITAIDFTNNILTLSTSISCASGDSVYLYTDTADNVVAPIGQNSPDIGAFPFISGTSSISPPTGLAAVVN